MSFSERIRREAEIPTFAVGMITGPHQAERVIADGQADLVALARAIMYDPRFAWHAAAALGAQTAYPRMYARCAPDQWPAHPARR